MVIAFVFFTILQLVIMIAAACSLSRIELTPVSAKAWPTSPSTTVSTPKYVPGHFSQPHQGAIVDEHQKMSIGSWKLCDLQGTIKNLALGVGGFKKHPKPPHTTSELALLLPPGPNASELEDRKDWAPDALA